MPNLWSYIICLVLGSGVTYLVVKRKPTPLKEKQAVSQLQAKNGKLELDKLLLQNRNGDLAQFVSQNQKNIQRIRKNDKALKEDFKIVLRQQITILEIMSSVTNIQEHSSDLNNRINVSQRLLERYESAFYESD